MRDEREAEDDTKLEGEWVNRSGVWGGLVEKKKGSDGSGRGGRGGVEKWMTKGGTQKG